jgi:hypothetical protein
MMTSKELLLQQPQQQQQLANPTPLIYEKETEDNKAEKKMLQDLEQEIECPRCYDIMVLSSDLTVSATFARNVTCHF